METRGITKIVDISDAEVGKFYLRRGFRDDEVIFFQCISFPSRDGDQKLALRFPKNNQVPRIDLMNGPAFIGELPDVHVRVDPHSLAGDEYSTSTSQGMLLITGDTPIVLAAGQDGYGWHAVDLSTGRVSEQRVPTAWAWFQRWRVVIDDEEEEVVLAVYDRARAGS